MSFHSNRKKKKRTKPNPGLAPPAFLSFLFQFLILRPHLSTALQPGQFDFFETHCPTHPPAPQSTTINFTYHIGTHIHIIIHINTPMNHIYTPPHTHTISHMCAYVHLHGPGCTLVKLYQHKEGLSLARAGVC